MSTNCACASLFSTYVSLEYQMNSDSSFSKMTGYKVEDQGLFSENVWGFSLTFRMILECTHISIQWILEEGGWGRGLQETKSHLLNTGHDL